MPLVYVLVITHNGKHHLEKCLPSLFATDYPHLRFLVIDNHSSDGTSNYVTRNFPKAQIMTHPDNYGFAKGNNLGIIFALSAGADYVVLLNDDTIILDPHWLKEAINVAEADLRVGMVGFDLKSETRVQIPDVICAKPVQAIVGCALFIRATLLQNLGLLDEVYFAYAEENDLEARAQRAGYKLIEINSPIYHLGGGTSKKFPLRRTYLLMRNVIRFSIKNQGFLRTLRKVIRIADVACNPYPFTFDKNDVTHVGMRSTGNVVINSFVFASALLWNLFALPHSLHIHQNEELLVKQTQKTLLAEK